MHLEIASIAPGILAFLVAALTAFLLSRGSGFYRRLLSADGPGRYQGLDGLRGFLAFGVFLSHCVSSYYWHLTGVWSWPPPTFYPACGSVAVSLFFMITGFLFWQRAIRDSGRIEARRFFGSRLRRLAPMYLFCVTLVFAVVGARTRWTLQVTPSDLALSLAAWAGLGMFGTPDINGLAHSNIIDPALWSLRYEWVFYLVLPFLAFLATPSRFIVPAIVGLALPLTGRYGVLAPNFVIGMAVAHLDTARLLPTALRSPAVAVGTLLLMALGTLAAEGDFAVVPSLAVGPLFAAVVAGNTFFGTLSSRTMRFLGTISYSVYVLHGILLILALGVINSVAPIAEMSAVTYWTLLQPVSAVVVLLSAATYRWIEHPFLRTTAVSAALDAGRPQLV